MLEMKPSLREEWPLCKALWKTAFGDDDAYIDNYYHNYYQPQRVVTLKDDGVLCGMLALFPLELRWPDGGLTKSSYLYALAIHPDFRGQGLSNILMRYADFYVGEQAVPFLSTVPAAPGLEKVFAAVDFQPCHPIDEAVVDAPAPGPEPARLVTAAEYRELREALLAGTGHAVYGEDYLEYQAKVSALASGGLFRMDTPAGHACAVAERTGDILDVRELLAPAGEQADALAALTARFPAVKSCRVRCPAGTCELPGAACRTFGMGKRVPPTPKILGETYFGLAFD